MVSKLGKLYYNIYNSLCGKHPYQYLWHFQFLSSFYLRKDLKKIGGEYLKGKLLDFGCGKKPYEGWFPNVTEHIGVDISDGKRVDYIYTDGEKLSFNDSYFDSCLCTQVIEHVYGIEFVMKEIYRSLKTSGFLLISVPFIYNEHGAPYDFQRLSKYGLIEFMNKYNFRIYKIICEGGIGSTIGTLLLNFINRFFNLNKITRIFKGVLIPVFICFSLLVNIISLMIDKIDKTKSFYGNILIVGKK